MSLEAEILGVSQPGEQVDILVAYREGSKEQRKTISFSGNGVTAEMITERIVDVGRKILDVSTTDVLAKGLIGQKITVQPAAIAVVDSEVEI